MAVQPALSPAPRNILRLIERLDHVRALGLAASRAATIPQTAFDRIADEAARITPQHLAELPDRRRHAILAAAGIRLEESLTDAVLLMMDIARQLGRSACCLKQRCSRGVYRCLNRIVPIAD